MKILFETSPTEAWKYTAPPFPSFTLLFVKFELSTIPERMKTTAPPCPSAKLSVKLQYSTNPVLPATLLPKNTAPPPGVNVTPNLELLTKLEFETEPPL